MAFGRHFTISEERKERNGKKIRHCPTQILVHPLACSAEEREVETKQNHKLR